MLSCVKHFHRSQDIRKKNDDTQPVVSQLEESDAENGIESELFKNKILFVYAYI